MTNDIEHFFYVLVGHLYVFFGDIFSSPLLYLNWVVCPVVEFISILYIFWTLNKLLSHIWSSNIFSHFVGCLLTLLIKFSLFLLLVLFGVISKKALSNPKSWRFTPMFSSRFYSFSSLGLWFILSSFLYMVWVKSPT